jgi:hypothetical protein
MVGMDVGLKEKHPCNLHGCFLFYGHRFRQKVVLRPFFSPQNNPETPVSPLKACFIGLHTVSLGLKILCGYRCCYEENHHAKAC